MIFNIENCIIIRWYIWFGKRFGWGHPELNSERGITHGMSEIITKHININN